MASKNGPELRNTGVALLIAAPTYPDWVPVTVKVGLLIVALSLLIWTWLPHRIGRFRMTFGLTMAGVAGLASVVGVALHFAAPRLLAASAETPTPPAALTRSPQSPAFDIRDSATFKFHRNNVYGTPSGLLRASGKANVEMSDNNIVADPEALKFPPPDGKYRHLSDADLEAKLLSSAAALRDFQRDTDLEDAQISAVQDAAARSFKSLDEMRAEGKANFAAREALNKRRSAKFVQIFEPQMRALVSEAIFRRPYIVRPSVQDPGTQYIRMGWTVVLSGNPAGSAPALSAAIFLEAVARTVS